MALRVIFLAVALGTAGLASSDAADAPAKIIPADWLPALAPSIQGSLDALKDANSQSEMNLLSRNVADMTDAQLFVAYVRLYERLPASQRAELLAEQTRWLAKRPKVARAGIQSEGGSLAPLEANNAELTYTEKRLADLRARFKALGGDTATAAKATAVDDESAPKKKTKKSADDDEPTPAPKKKKKRAAASEEQ